MGGSRRWVIGRAPDGDVVVGHTGVSWRHCALNQTELGFFLEDLGSTNGTFVNGLRIRSSVPVRPHDKITLGKNLVLPWPVGEGPGAERGVRKVERRAPSAERKAPDPEGTAPIAPRSALCAPRFTRILGIGRGPENDIVLDFPMVSQHHARLTITSPSQLHQKEDLHLEDLGSRNGTGLNHPSRKIRQARLSENDVVYFGSLRVPVSRLLEGIQRPREKVLAPGDQPLILGRDAGCDCVLDSPMISQRHTRLVRSSAGVVLEDLGSAQGTYVNGRRAEGPVLVQPGDVIGLGRFSFTLSNQGTLQSSDYRGNLTLQARGIAVDVGGEKFHLFSEGKKRLLEDVSLTIYPSELVGLMGPSGAGKTTLMNALNGYKRPTQGQVLLGGMDLYANYRRFAPFLGYVPQDDIMHRDLTVGQALYFSARLRLPPDFSDADIHRRIRTVLGQLGLEGTENVLIGSPEKKGISGGQRKRVNLAMELLTDPLVLFLDEPTSGLSSEDALTVMKTLRALANQGKTILLTIHQPSLEIYRLMDNLVLVAKEPNSLQPGRQVFYGPAFPDALQFFNPTGSAEREGWSAEGRARSAERGGPGRSSDGESHSAPGALPSTLGPDDLLRGLGKKEVAQWVRDFHSSGYHREYVQERATRAPSNPSAVPSLPERPSGSFWCQWQTLLARCLAIKAKDRINTIILLAQAPLVGVLIVLVFGKQVSQEVSGESWPNVFRSLGTTLFLTTLSALWFGASNAIREIVGEWAIYHRERMINLGIPAYVASKFTILGGLGLIQCAVLLGIVGLGCGLEGPWPLLYVLLFLAALVGTALGLTVSALARTSEVAIAVLPIFLLGMVILGGTMAPIHTMHTLTQNICAANPARWTFEGLILLESERRPEYQPPTLPGTDPEPIRDMAEHYFPRASHRGSPDLSLLILLIQLAVLAVLIHLALRNRDVHRRKWIEQ